MDSYSIGVRVVISDSPAPRCEKGAWIACMKVSRRKKAKNCACAKRYGHDMHLPVTKSSLGDGIACGKRAIGFAGQEMDLKPNNSQDCGCGNRQTSGRLPP
jgi:hypothetical protein